MNCVELTYELPDGVHYRVCTYQPESGPGDKLPVVMLHGFAGSSDSFSHIAPGLNRTVVAVDLLGHGGSTPAADPARYHVERQLDDLTLLLNGIHQAGQGYHLMGYSMGGRLAMRLALRKPAGLKSLAIESSSPGITQESEREQRRKRDHQLAARIRSDMHTFFAGWNRLPLFQSPDDAPAEVRKHFEELQLKNTPAALAANLEGFGAGNLNPVHQELTALSIPFTAITGSLDAAYTDLWAALRPAISNMQHIVIAGAGHRVHLDKPDAYIQQLNQFLTNAEPSL